MPSFSEHFWGDKNNGFDILYHNMKHGQLSSKEFADFLRESCSIEETYAKLLSKLAKYASNYGAQGHSWRYGSFAPFWQVMKSLVEKLSNLHMQLMHSWQELMKDVQKYTEEQHKKHRSIKESEAGTLEIVQSIQQTTVAVQKAKEYYHARCLEYEKLKRENASAKDLEKAEMKYKRSNEDYRALIAKYSNVRNDFEVKMSDSCKLFQEIEVTHLKQMKEFVDSYSKGWENQHILLGQVHEEFRKNSTDLTIDNLIDALIKSKTTGTEKPGPIEFVEADLSSLTPAAPSVETVNKEIPILEKPGRTAVELEGNLCPPRIPAPGSSSDNSHRLGFDLSPQLRASAKWFLSKRGREKKKEKKRKKKEQADKEINSDDKKEAEVDEEGFRIQPDNPFENQDDRTSWTTSDSDSDSEDSRRKIKVEIKPIGSNLSSNSATTLSTVDDLRRSVEGLRISPPPVKKDSQNHINDSSMKRSFSATDNMFNTASTPNNVDRYAAFTSPKNLLSLNEQPLSASSANNSLNNFSPGSQNDISLSKLSSLKDSSLDSGSLSTGSTISGPINSSSMNLGGPSSSTAPPLLPAPPKSSTRNLSSLSHPHPRSAGGRQSPAASYTWANKMDRADSVSSIGQNFGSSSMSFGSRGPSPLTIGMSDTIPLAVAFSETINTLFSGVDIKNMKVKLTGDMVISFPAGIVKVLTENPFPAQLSFSIQHVSNLEHILVNKDLVVQDNDASTNDNSVYCFEMSALMDHLRKQALLNKTASYFNIDILKYQVSMERARASIPLILEPFWRCEPLETDFFLKYSYNSSSMNVAAPLHNVSFIVPVKGDVTNVQSQPTASWSEEHNRAVWKCNQISDMDESAGKGSIKARFNIKNGPSQPTSVAVQFMCEGALLSGIEFHLYGSGYRVSLVKQRFLTGKYIADPEEIKYV